MKTALVSDIHSNLEALLAVLADIESQDVSRTFCLGDIINYGPEPAACLRLVRRLDLTLLGNHEEAMLNRPFGFNPTAAEAAAWTRAALRPNFLSDGSKWANWEFMSDLPVRHDEDGVLFVHASPRSPTSEYLLPSDAELVLGSPSQKLTECFELTERICFVGHTHLPGVFRESGGFATPADLGGELRVPDGEKIIVNIGSVGQPRDHDPRACYVTFDGEVIRFRRVVYDAETTYAKVKAARGLPEWCGRRLLEGQ